MKKTLLLAIFAIAFLIPRAPASTLNLSLTNWSGFPDTNFVRVVQADTNITTLSNGGVITIGTPVRYYPSTNGQVSIFGMVGNYAIYGPTLGQGLLYRFPDSTTNLTAYPLSGFNTFQTVLVNTNGGSVGGSTNLFNSDFTTNAGLIAVSPTSPTVTAIATNLFGFGATGLFGALEAPALYFGGLVSGGTMLNGFIGLNGKLYDTNGVKFYDSANNTFSGTLNGNATSITGTLPASQVTGGVVTNLPAANFVSLSPAGNNATGLRNHFEKPFQNLSNAVAVLQAKDILYVDSGWFYFSNATALTYPTNGISVIGKGAALSEITSSGQNIGWHNMSVEQGSYFKDVTVSCF